VTRVLIDCTALPANRAGVGRYLEGLLTGLESTDIDLVVVGQERDVAALALLAPTAHIESVPPRFTSRGLRLLWEQFGLPSIARRLRVDVIHSPHYTFPLLWRGGRVVTVHDATFFSDPEVHSALKRFFFRTWIRLDWRSADVVVAPSAATVSEVERYLGDAKAHVIVAHHGVDARLFHAPSTAAVTEFARDIPAIGENGWFAFLGTIEPRKNLGALLDAHAMLGEGAPPLLVSGGRGWDADVLARLDAGQPGVVALGYLPFEQLPALLGGATAVMYPSLGEGFGLPVLEAMSCGAAVITTDRLALPEVGGEAVEYTEVDAAAIAQTMRDLLASPDRRAELSGLATARAAQFTWEATAAGHAKAYEASLNR